MDSYLSREREEDRSWSPPSYSRYPLPASTVHRPPPTTNDGYERTAGPLNADPRYRMVDGLSLRRQHSYTPRRRTPSPPRPFQSSSLYAPSKRELHVPASTSECLDGAPHIPTLISEHHQDRASQCAIPNLQSSPPTLPDTSSRAHGSSSLSGKMTHYVLRDAAAQTEPTAPVEPLDNLAMPPEFTLSSLPDDCTHIIDALRSGAHSPRTFLSIAAEYKRTERLVCAERVAVAGLQSMHRDPLPMLRS